MIRLCHCSTQLSYTDESMTGLEPATLGSLCEVCLIYGTCLCDSEATGGEVFLNYTSKLVAGIEPATFGTIIRRSNHCEAFLSYGTHYDSYKVVMQQSQKDFY